MTLPQNPNPDLGTHGDALPKPKGKFAEVGHEGLYISAGYVQDEFLPALRGDRAIKVFREMSDNDPVIGGMLHGVEMLARAVDWSVEPDEEDDGEEAADFTESCFHDMSISWEDTVSQIMSMVKFGWHFAEIVYKKRDGFKPESANPSAPASSKHDDGKIGWRKLPGRAQETRFRWEVDQKSGTILGMHQRVPHIAESFYIPIQKALLFRTKADKNNPEGRALALDTPIPTPDGWRTMADLTAGDKVFDEAGRIRYVTATAEWADRPCFLVTFNDGSEIIADANHEWPTTLLWERAKNLPPSRRTTERIAATVKNSNGVSNHAIVWAGALDYPAQDLLVDPYYLGLWLGDGTALSSSVSCHADDLDETMRLIEETGYPCKSAVNGGSDNGRLIRVYGGAQASLSELGVKGNKHIPAAYLRGSVAQRRALLAGLMDSDGHVDADGRCEFVNTNRSLIDGVAELVRSLGTGCSITIRRHAIEGERALTWAVRFTPTDPPFRLTRKIASVHTTRARRNHYIVSVEPVDNRPTKCIEVDGPSHLFLAGTSLVPTSNSALRNAYRPWYFKTHIEQIEAVGIERDLAGFPVMWVPSTMMAADASDEEKATLELFKDIVRNIKRDEQEGLVMPLAYDESGNKMYDITLLSSGGARQIDVDATIARYNQQIAMTIMADFLMLGHEGVGSKALGVTKVDLFLAGLEAWLDGICDVFNTHAIPRLMRLNNMDPTKSPKLTHSKIQSVDPAVLGAAIQALAAAGMPLFPDDALESSIRESVGLPEKSPDAAPQAMVTQPGDGVDAEGGKPGEGGASPDGKIAQQAQADVSKAPSASGAAGAGKPGSRPGSATPPKQTAGAGRR